MDIVKYFTFSKTKAASLAAFRILFSLLMIISLIRFICYGWVEQFYVLPGFHFKYYGFSWVHSLGAYTYLLFGIAIICSVFVLLGYKYRIAMTLFFLTFTYIELIDKTTYLNHYYFTSVLSFLLIFLPLNATFSMDAYVARKRFEFVPKWTVDSIKILLLLVYFYAGLSKLNSDWLFRAQPLKIWLSSKTHLPIIGTLMNENWFHYTMSWSGALYDLTIPFLLWYSRTTKLAFILVIVFHVLTHVLFNIGMFPYIMIFATTIFFKPEIHEGFLNWVRKIINFKEVRFQSISVKSISKFSLFIVLLLLVFQLLFPLRSKLYSKELFWTEQGFRFSWRVMLMEKAGDTSFYVRDSITKKRFHVKNSDFLTSFQAKQMSFQPDFILEYAHYLGDHFMSQGHKNIEIFADSYVALNGRLVDRFINPNINLYKEKEGFQSKDWILPFKDEIKGY